MNPTNTAVAVGLCLTLLCLPASSEDGPRPGAALRGPCLGQKPPGSSATLFAPGLVSTPNLEHSRLLFSPDGREMYWAVVPAPVNEETDETRLMFVRESGAGWSRPAALPFAPAGSCSPALSPDGRTLYFLSSVAQSGGGAAPPRQIVWEVKRVAGGWAPPRATTALPIAQPGRMTLAFGFARGGNLYFDRGGPGTNGRWEWGLYVSEFSNGRYREPRLLGDGINEGGRNQTPFIAPDEGCLIFSSWREGGLGGGDLYASFREGTAKWSAPRRLPESVNTRAQERFPSLSPDGRYLFFSRSGGETLDDFFWIQASVIDSARARGE